MRAFLAVMVVLALAVPVWAQGGRNEDGPCGLPPEGKPQRIKGGESFPPLPLPATPLRRTERKREPAPPTLVGKVTWGEKRTTTRDDGTPVTYLDWNLDPADSQGLLKFANQRLGVRYKPAPVDLRTFSWSVDEIPVLYISGKQAPQFDETVRRKMRQYLDAGGTLWADACSGSTKFTEAMRSELAEIFPDRPLRRLGPDHALFRCVYLIDKVKYSAAAATERPDGLPYLEGIEIGCRTAVILAPYGMSCAWDSFHVNEGARTITGNSALLLGTNMVAYALATFDLGKFLSRRKSIEAADDQLKGDFVFAQVRHAGNWDPDPSAFAQLLKTTIAATNTKINFGRKEIALTDPDLASYPFLYVTGHGPLDLSEEESAALGRYLKSGGFLLADACCGGLEFDQSFRREIRRALPDDGLKDLPRDHPVYGTFYPIQAVDYTTQVKATFKDLSAPTLEGVVIGDELRVVYSRFDLGCGWEGQDHPYARGVASKDAMRLGINIIIYVLSH